ncbi:MAG: LuxR C-terminal-related transcriptional regulator, partial [Ktedonobacteraceae bacterium]
RLDQADLFLYPLDGAGQWYRYHALFAEAMQHEAHQRFSMETWHALYARASRWYEEHALPSDAIDSALASRDFAHAADLMQQLVDPHLAGNEYYTLLHRFEQLPEENLQARPVLCLAYATALLFLHDRRAPATRVLLERPLQIAERIWQAEGNSARLGEVETLRAASFWWQGDFVQAFQISRRALELLPAHAALWRGICLLHLSVAEIFDGQPERAKQLFLEAYTANEEASNSYGVRACLFFLCDIHLAQGELHLAAQVYQRIFTESEASNDFTDTGAALQYLAMLAYEWNDLETARQQATLTEEILKRFSEDEVLTRTMLLLARLQHVRGETVQAQQDLTALAARVQHWPHLLRSVYTCQARLALASGDLITAQQRASASAQYSNEAIFVQREEDALLNARLLIAQGKATEALRLLLPWQEEARMRGLTRSLLEILVLQALAHHARKDTPQAHQALLQALTLARAENYQRLFLDEGSAMFDLLRSLLPAIHEEPLKSYARGLLLAATREGAMPGIFAPTVEPLLLEPLSRQEKRVLRLLAAGRSNPEIARELIVSVNTIKTQVQSIYSKLDVNSRQEAREAARKLRLV